jgi:hypothetical protein
MPPHRQAGIEYPVESIEDASDYFSSVILACGLLQNAGYRFRLAGFGREDWNLDVGYDMSTVIEQLPSLLRGLRSTGSGEVDLYSQGLEATFSFERKEDLAFISCHSRIKRQIKLPMESIRFDLLEQMLVRLAMDFSNALYGIAPELVQNPPFCSWREGVV